MIFQLPYSFHKCIARFLLIIHAASITAPVFATGAEPNIANREFFPTNQKNFSNLFSAKNIHQISVVKPVVKLPLRPIKTQEDEDKGNKHYVNTNILGSGGPSQPEMSSFKSIGVDNMVNLFTGDFSYNIPLMDVGGYPINIFYDGSIGMEQEASWVGLGWNINPGTINRNMRGVPDDFSGTDKELLEQTQIMKPNITWGARFGPDYEFIGIKAMPSVGADLGVSINNYLGPAVELGIKGSVNLSLAKYAAGEKTASLNLGLNANASSRGGLTISGNASLSANAFTTTQGAQGGVGLRLGTSYNSRSGIKELQISEQMSFNRGSEKVTGDNSVGASLASTTISFAKPSYIPSIRMPVTNSSFSGHFQLGGALWGNYGSAEVEVYKQQSEVAKEDFTTKKPMIGYLHYQNAQNNDNAVMDFTRFNDNEVTSKTPIISAPQYSYDVFSIQGEGTGGNIRAYRNDLGYVRDSYTHSRDKNFSAGGDIGVPGHIGANFNMIKTPANTGEWRDGNTLKTALVFGDAALNYENVYFRNPGENSVLNIDQYKRIGGGDMVRFKLGASTTNPTISTTLEKFDKSGSKISLSNGGEVDITTPDITGRKKRTQVINFLTAEEATLIGLDKKIKSYKDIWSTDGFKDNTLQPDPIYPYGISRVSDYRGAKHISQINVTEANGRRYIYGIPVYNRTQQDFTFSVANTEMTGSNDADKVSINGTETTSSSPHLSSSSDNKKDGYLQVITTPAYSHSFLLSGLLSPDYVDISGDGITEDDLGTAVKFNYTKIDGFHNWRTPSTKDDNIANFNPGKLTETKDDKGIISYGERESWYMHSIESKTMIAVFKLENRNDGKGISSYLSNGNENTQKYLRGIDGNDNTQKLLRRIDLYSKADLNKNGLTGAKPIKTVNFVYDYSLCKGTADNSKGEAVNAAETNSGGKLTLKAIYFTYNGQARANTQNNRSKYVFAYENTDGTGNPDYKFNASDRWGTFKAQTDNSNPLLKNALYPYSTQVKTTADQNAGAWSLKKILLPSGGQIEATYESDDYAFVQNKRAENMMEIAGFSNTSTPLTPSSNLYERNVLSLIENNYAFVKVPEALFTGATPTSADIETARNKYLSGLTQLVFKLAVNMPNGIEYVTCYAELADQNTNFGIYNTNTIWIQLKPVDGFSPLSLTVIEYLREQLPGQAYTGYDVSGSTGLAQVGEMFKGLLTGIRDAFSNPLESLRLKDHKAQSVDKTKSFVRLNNPYGIKLGGGQRVKEIRLKDNWKAMTNQYTSEYGQTYDYTTTEIFNGATRTISSGVASYEPSLGGEENPFHTILSVANKLPLGPASYGAIEMPILDAFFPAPSVGYSKVTVRSLPKTNPAGKSLSGVGKQVTEFYTAKDFPVYYNNTSLDPLSDLQYHQSSFGAFFYKTASDSRAISQGFIVATNDMHGKMKSQTSYPENDNKTPISYTENFYRNTGVKGLDEKFDFVSAADGGAISEGNMGIDIELMTDTREFSVKSTSLEIQAQVDLFPVVLPFWLPFIWPVVGKTDNTYRAVTTTKVISYHSIIDSVVVIDKGSRVSTKNLVYDAETGDVIVNRTNNEFNRPVYNTSYPAWWAYSGMGSAYKNVDAIYTASFRDGAITSGMSPTMVASAFESGDELYLFNPGASPTDNCASALNPEDATLLWAFNTHKNTSSLTDPAPDFVFIDSKGKLYSKDIVTFKIVRSGKRNMLDAKAATVTTMVSPVALISAATSTTPAKRGLEIDALNNAAAAETINATAAEFKEKWHTDNDVFNTYSLYYPPAGEEKVINGNLINGDISFSSGYSPYPIPPNSSYSDGHEGTYSVVDNSNKVKSDWSNCISHNPLDGKMMVVNASTVSGKVVWSEDVLVTPANVYNFSVWATSVSGGNPARLMLLIDGVQVGKTYTLGGICSWGNVLATWSSGTKTNVRLSIVDENTEGNGNDFAIDDISFRIPESCTPLEVADCNGYLEKNINPYVKGLLGNFRIYQNKVFYDYRRQRDPLVSTNLSKDGMLSDFHLYWNFNSNNLIPNENSKQWIFQSQVTKVNAKGLQLETKDANNIYTAAQYGYNKTIPVAIGNNARYNEMFFEGFEDADYNESLNGVIGNSCLKKHIDFGSSNIVNANVFGFNAHTGKKVMKVENGNTTIPVSITVTDEASDFALLQQNDITKVLSDVRGGNFYANDAPRVGVSNPPATFSDFGMSGIIGLNPVPYGQFLSATDRTIQYFQVSECGKYRVNAHSHKKSDFASNYGSDAIWKITSVQSNQEIPRNAISHSSNNTNGEYVSDDEAEVSLEKGIYEMEVNYGNSQANFVCGDDQNCNKGAYADFTVNLSSPLISYKSLDLTSGCHFTKPIPATTDMQNPTFSIPQNRKMLFSAWVKEDFNNPQSIQFKYTNASGQPVTSTDPSSPLAASGPIIEGWRRYEGTFTTPLGSTNLNLSFVNTSDEPIYFDDIRIHPFNANIKSYVYDPVNLRLTAELDANNYAKFYEYDEEGTLIRTKAETKEGIKTITETRSAKQRAINDFQ